MKRVITIVLVLAGLVLAQDFVMVDSVKGVGPDRTQALEDAKRNAVEQALGVAIGSETQMESFRVVRDVVSSRAEGYITDFKVLRETPFPDRYEVWISGKVTRSQLKADAKTLQSALGGFRIMVWYDFRSIRSPRDSENFEYAQDRVNEFLSSKGLRYVERKRFEALKQQARELLPDTTQPLTVAQNMAFMADVPVFWDMSRLDVPLQASGVAGIAMSHATLDIKAYDTYTAEGMGTAVFRGDQKAEYGAADAGRTAIDLAAQGACDKLLYQMNRYLGDWVLNGKPYTLRFYGIASYKTLRLLKEELKGDPRFGGQLEVVSAKDYAQLDLTFKGAADELADATLDYTAKVPGLEDVDVLCFLKNQVNFYKEGTKPPADATPPGSLVPMRSK